MTTVSLSPVLKQQFTDTNGKPLANGQVWTYQAGTLTPQATYTDATGLAANTNPVILDSAGRANIWLNSSQYYKFVIQDVNSVTQFTEDNIAATPMANFTGQKNISYATAGQTVFTLPFTYQAGQNVLNVFLNGAKLIVGVDYLESSSSTFTLVKPAVLNDVLEVDASAILTLASSSVNTQKQSFLATAGQTVFTLSFTYTNGLNTLNVYMNGSKLLGGTDYTETSSNSFTLTAPAALNDLFEVNTTGLSSLNTAAATSVSYTPSGTGAVATTVAGKLQQTVSVLDFYSGSRDYTSAFNAALAASNSVYIPGGTYPISGAVNLPSSARLWGAGSRAVTIMATNAAATLTNTSAHFWITLQGFTFNGNSLSTTGINLGIPGGAQGSSAYDALIDVNIASCTTGLLVNSVQYMMINHCQFTAMTGYGFKAVALTTSWITYCNFAGNVSGIALTNYGGATSGCSGIYLQNTYFSTPISGGAALIFIDGAYDIHLSNLQLENTSVTSVATTVLQNTNGSIVTGNIFFTECVWLGLAQAQDLIKITSATRVFFTKCRAIQPTAGNYILNNSSGTNIEITDCFAGTGYTDFTTYYWTDSSYTTGTITQQKSLGGPAFSAYLGTTSFGISNGVYAKVPCQVKEFDTNTNYDNVTNYRFTPTQAGYYQVTGAITYSGTTVTQGNAVIYKNGSSFKSGSYLQLTTLFEVQVTALIYMNGTTDYLELWGFCYGTGTLVFQFGASATYFQAFLARPA